MWAHPGESVDGRLLSSPNAVSLLAQLWPNLSVLEALSSCDWSVTSGGLQSGAEL